MVKVMFLDYVPQSSVASERGTCPHNPSVTLSGSLGGQVSRRKVCGVSTIAVEIMKII